MLDELIEHLMCGFLPGLAREMGIGYHVESRITYHSLEVEPGSRNLLLAEEDRRVNYHVYNKSGATIYIADSSQRATEEHFTTEVGANSGYAPDNNVHPYKGDVTFKPAVSTTSNSDYLLVTEYILVKDK